MASLKLLKKFWQEAWQAQRLFGSNVAGTKVEGTRSLDATRGMHKGGRECNYKKCCIIMESYGIKRSIRRAGEKETIQIAPLQWSVMASRAESEGRTVLLIAPVL